MEPQLPVLELQYVDDTGTKGTTTVKYPIGTTVAVIDAQATALASLIAPITGCVLIRQRIIYKAVVTPRPVPDVGSTIKRQGVFLFSVDPPSPYGLIAVPGILEEVLSDVEPFAGYAIDRDNAAIINFVDTVIAGDLTNPFGDALTSLAAAYRQSRA